MKRVPALFFQHVAPAAACFAAIWFLARTEWFQRVENMTLDARTQLRALHQPPADPRWLVIGIDDESIADKNFGRWPWPRQVHGQILYWLAQEKPSVVSWDILFTLPDTQNPMNDQALIAGARAAKDTAIVFGAHGTDEEAPFVPPPLTPPFPRANLQGDASRIMTVAHAAEPLPELLQVARIGFVDVPPAADGVRRMAPLLIRVGDGIYPSLSLQTILSFWHVPATAVRIKLGDAIYFPTPDGECRVPIDGTGGFFVNYRRALANTATISYINLAQYLEAKYSAHVSVSNAPQLEGKILLVGQMAVGLADMGPTPLSRLSPLPLVHANVIDNILRRDFVRVAPGWLVWLLALAVTIAATGYLWEARIWLHVLGAVAVPVLYFATAAALWIGLSLAMPVAAPVVAFGTVQLFALGRRVLAEQRAKAEIKGMFASYLSPTVVERMVASGTKPQLGGHVVEITAYFSDIQKFSTFSEMMPAEKLVELLNEYLTACTDILQEEGGTLDKYIGDAVVAMFGTPISLPDHAYRACVVSQRVQARLAELREKWRAEGGRWPKCVHEMRSRIGLNTGRCVIGNMGSRTRFNYTMMGDDVNLAARMESGAKTFGVYTMCTEATKRDCERHGGDRVVFRALGSIVVQGRSHPVPIFEVLGLKEAVASAARDCAAEFEEGLRRYFARDWAAAIARFRRSAELEPNRPGVTPGVTTNPSIFYLALAEAYSVQPPDSDWNGVYQMKDK